MTRDPDIEEAVLDMISQDRTEAEQRAFEAELMVEAQAIELERLRECLVLIQAQTDLGSATSIAHRALHDPDYHPRLP